MGEETKFFVEVGTCDFDTLLPLVKQGWEGLMIEPVPELFDNLPKKEGIIYDNCAVSDNTGKSIIRYYDLKFTESEEGVYWTRGVGSINPNRNHFISNPDWAKWEKTSNISCYTLDDLFDKHEISSVDLLKLDCEAMDYRILKAFSFEIKPAVIMVETQHDEAPNSIKALLESKDYLILDDTSPSNLVAIW